MDRYTRHQLKQDDFQNTLESLQLFYEAHQRAILGAVAAIIIVVAGTFIWKNHAAHQENAANAELQAAIGTFDAYVGPAQQNSLMEGDQTFPTEKAKYQQALKQFSAVAEKYPSTKAAGYAKVHMAICAAGLGNDKAAIQQLQQLSQSSDPEIASIAKLSLAGEFVKTGKTDQAAKVYQEIAAHPTTTVPRATAQLALASIYRSSNPARAREIYDQVQNEYGSDTVISSDLKQQIETLPSKAAK